MDLHVLKNPNNYGVYSKIQKQSESESQVKTETVQTSIN